VGFLDTRPPSPAKGSLIVSSRPLGAAIWVDGRNTGRVTDDVVPGLPAGRRHVELRLAGYESASLRAEVPDGGVLRLGSVELQRLLKRITIASEPTGATVTLDGDVQKGTTPLQLDDVPWGTHHVLLRRGEASWQGTIDVGADEDRFERRLVAKPRPRPPVQQMVVSKSPTPARTFAFEGRRLLNRYSAAHWAARLLQACHATGPVRPVSFSDLDPRYTAVVRDAVGAEILQGYDGQFAGRRLINRYQMSVILSKLIDRIGAKRLGGPTERPVPPSDLPRTHWACASVMQCMSYDLLSAYEGKFEGQRLVDRFQAATIFARLGRMCGLPRSSAGIACDVPPDHWASDAVQACLRMGLADEWSESGHETEGGM